MGTEWQDEVPYPGPSYEQSLSDAWNAFIERFYKPVKYNWYNWYGLSGTRGFGKHAAILDEINRFNEAVRRSTPPIKAHGEITGEFEAFMERKNKNPNPVGPRPRRQYDKYGRRRY